MRKDFSGDLQVDKRANNRDYRLTLSAGPDQTLTYTDDNMPAPPVVGGVDWIAVFLVTGQAGSGDFGLSIAGELPPGKREFVVYCRLGSTWQERQPNPSGRWALPPGDPAVGIR